jgi:hypothetical protein
MPCPIIYPLDNISEIKKQIPEELLTNKLDQLINTIAESYDDFCFWKKLNNNLIYALLINSVSNNYYSIYSYNDLVNPELKKKLIFNENPSTKIATEFYNINYTSEIEKKIKSKLDNKTKYYYLYHGSPFYCWNSIIKNGLKVMSGTKFMSAGSAYGNGIYASNKLSISHTYCNPKEPFNYSMIGVFQVIENPQKYEKTTGIFVIPNEKILILRTLIKINDKTNITIHKQLDDYFIIQRIYDKHTNDKNLLTVKNKRLSAELKLIDKYSVQHTVYHLLLPNFEDF